MKYEQAKGWWKWLDENLTGKDWSELTDEEKAEWDRFAKTEEGIGYYWGHIIFDIHQTKGGISLRTAPDMLKDVLGLELAETSKKWMQDVYAMRELMHKNKSRDGYENRFRTQ